MINFYDHVREKIAELCPEASIVLEAGSGECKLINLLTKRKPALLVGCDKLDYAEKHRALSVPFVRCSITHLPFKDECFATSIVSNVFLELTRQEVRKTIKEAARVTRKNGFFLLTSYNLAPFYSIKMILRWKIFIFSIFPIGYKLNFIRDELKKNGINIISVIPFVLHPEGVERISLISKLIKPLSIFYHNLSMKNTSMSLMFLFQSVKT